MNGGLSAEEREVYRREWKIVTEWLKLMCGEKLKDIYICDPKGNTELKEVPYGTEI